MKRVLFSSYLVVMMMLCGCSQKYINTETPEQTSGGFLAIPVHINTTERTDRHFIIEGIYYPEEGKQERDFRLSLYPPRYSEHFTFSKRLPSGRYQIQRYDFIDDKGVNTSLQDSEEDLLTGGSYSFIIKDGEVSMLSRILQIVVATLDGKKQLSWYWINSLGYGYNIDHFRKMLDVEIQSDYWAPKLGKARNFAEKDDAYIVSNHSGLVSYSNNTVVDITNRLMWAAYDNGYDIDWYTANKYCENYKLAGFENWRMPSEQELSALFEKGIKYEGDSDDFIRISDMFIWTSKKLGSVGAQLFNQKTGNTTIFSPTNLKRNRILPIRDMAPGEAVPKTWSGRQVAFQLN